MTVGELIQELQKYPSNKEVDLICEFDGGWASTLPNKIYNIGIDDNTKCLVLDGKEKR